MQATQYNKTACGGYKPLLCAGSAYYYNTLLPKLEEAILKFESWKYDNVKSKYTYINIDIPHMMTQISIECDDKSLKSYLIADLHYAPKFKQGKFTERDFNAWARMGTVSPFRIAQQYMLEKGFYLIEENDSKNKNKSVVRLYKNMSPYPSEKLWHDHNKIFGVVTPNNKKESIKQTTSKTTSTTKSNSKKINSFNSVDSEFPNLPNIHNSDKINDVSTTSTATSIPNIWSQKLPEQIFIDPVNNNDISSNIDAVDNDNKNDNTVIEN